MAQSASLYYFCNFEQESDLEENKWFLTVHLHEIYLLTPFYPFFCLQEKKREQNRVTIQCILLLSDGKPAINNGIFTFLPLFLLMYHQY